MIPNGESFYEVLDRIKKMLHKILESKEEKVCLVSHGAIFNLLGCYVCDSPLSKFWTFYMSGCGVCKIVMKGIDDFNIKYWNECQHLK